jgi:hypothetical protein
MLRHLTAFGDDPTKQVTFFLGDGPDAAQSSQWISAQAAVELQPLKSLSLLRIRALHSARDLIDAEIGRLTKLYNQAEASLR